MPSKISQLHIALRAALERSRRSAERQRAQNACHVLDIAEEDADIFQVRRVAAGNEALKAIQRASTK